MGRSRSALVVAAVALAIVSSGCGKKLFECRSLVKTINPSMEKLNALASKKSDATSPDDIKQMAAVLDSTAAGVAKLDISTPELKKYADDYIAMCKETSGSFQQMLTTVSSVEAAGKTMETLSKATEANMKSFQDLCSHGKPPAECLTIAKKLQQFPSDPEKVAELDKFIGDLGKIPLKNAAVKALVADFTKNLTESSRLMKQIQDGSKKVAATGEALQKVTARESAIIDGLNSFCGAK